MLNVKQLSIIFALVLTVSFTRSESHAALNLIGLEGELQHHSEYLFGYSGAYNAELSLQLQGGGSATLSTNGYQGWWSATEGNNDSNTNYLVGDLSNNGTQLYNNFFSFALSSLAGTTVTSATLNLQREFGGSSTGQSSQLYNLYDVSTDFATLNNNDGTSQTIFDDLGSGDSYGSFLVALAGSSFDILSFSLNGDGLADLNAAIGGGEAYFSLGGTLTPSESVVPEPATLFVWSGLGLAVAGSVYAKRRKSLQSHA